MWEQGVEAVGRMGQGRPSGEGRRHKFPAFHGAKKPVISPAKATLGPPQRPSQRLPSDRPQMRCLPSLQLP